MGCVGGPSAQDRMDGRPWEDIGFLYKFAMENRVS